MAGVLRSLQIEADYFQNQLGFLIEQRVHEGLQIAASRLDSFMQTCQVSPTIINRKGV